MRFTLVVFSGAQFDLTGTSTWKAVVVPPEEIDRVVPVPLLACSPVPVSTSPEGLATEPRFHQYATGSERAESSHHNLIGIS